LWLAALLLQLLRLTPMLCMAPMATMVLDTQGLAMPLQLLPMVMLLLLLLTLSMLPLLLLTLLMAMLLPPRVLPLLFVAMELLPP